VVRELYGVMAARGAAGGFVVTSGRFTAEAMSFAEGRNVRLVDRSKLHGLIRQAQGSARPQQDVAKSEQAAKEAPPSAAPTCPACAKAMVRRTAKRGANVGGEFWGCTSRLQRNSGERLNLPLVLPYPDQRPAALRSSICL